MANMQAQKRLRDGEMKRGIELLETRLSQRQHCKSSWRVAERRWKDVCPASPVSWTCDALSTTQA